jgi:uncharacterized protein (TIGR02594 family)
MYMRQSVLLALCSVTLPVLADPAFAAPPRPSTALYENPGWLGQLAPQANSRRQTARERRQASRAVRQTSQLSLWGERDPSAPISGQAETGSGKARNRTTAKNARTQVYLAAEATPWQAQREEKDLNVALESYAPATSSRSGAAAERRSRNSYASVAPASAAADTALPYAASGAPLIAEARRYMGTNPTNRRSLWCGAFLNLVLERSGRPRGSSDLAKSFTSYGTRVRGPQVGAIAVMSRGENGGHVGIVTGIDATGNPIIISGNHNNTVAEVPYPRGRIFAYVLPDGSGMKRATKQAASNTGGDLRNN